MFLRKGDSFIATYEKKTYIFALQPKEIQVDFTSARTMSPGMFFFISNVFHSYFSFTFSISQAI